MKYLQIAFNLLTTLPVRAHDDWQPGDSGRAAGWYPLVGLIIGLLVAAVWTVSSWVFPPLVCAGLTLAAWILLTGGLHLDGLADCCDGLFHASNPERRLQIMKDPHLGAFGAMGLVLTLLLKFAALASLPSERTILAILLSASLGRWIILLAGDSATCPPRWNGRGLFFRPRQIGSGLGLHHSTRSDCASRPSRSACPCYNSAGCHGSAAPHAYPDLAVLPAMFLACWSKPSKR